MKYALCVAILMAFCVGVAGFAQAQTADETLLGDGCYVIPTSSSLVKVLVGAEERDDVLVSVLTSGEVWVLKTFFSLTPTETNEPENLEICLRTR